MPSLTIDLNPTGSLHRMIASAVRDRVQASKSKLGRRHEAWLKAEERTLAYLPEREIDVQRRLLREEGGRPQYTTIQIPYTYAVLMASHTYWTTVFLSRDPIWQYSGRHGETEQNVQAVEAMIAYQNTVGKMMVPLYLWLYDVGKYGLGVIGHYWDEEYAHISRIEEREQSYLGLINTGRTKKVKVTERLKVYEGNRLHNIRPMDFFPDPRHALVKFQDGEFCAIYGEIGWNTVLRREDLGYYTNIDKIRASDAGASERVASTDQLDFPETNYEFNTFDGKGKRIKSPVVKYYECCIDLVPSKWGLGKGDYPEKWMFTVTHDFQTVFGAQPLGAHHNKFPYEIMELEPEAYALVPRSTAEILAPVQNTLDWLFNSHFYAVRKTLNNQFIVDPSKIVLKDYMDSIMGGMIRLKPSAYGTDVRTAMEQVTVQDQTQNHLRDIQVMMEVGARISGVNDQIMGMMQRSGRRVTAQEFRGSTTFGVNRLKTSSEYFSAMGWAPLGQVLVQNSQQYYDDEMKFKLVGDLAAQANERFINVTPESIAGFYDYVPVDGALPIDRFAQANLWRELFVQITKMPGLAERYDMGKIFEWVAQLAGLKNITQFRIQPVPDQQLLAQAQQGNVVPLGGGGGGPLPDLGRVPEPGQVGGMGTTG